MPQAIIVMLLKKIGTDALLFIMKELIKMLEKRPDNNINEQDVEAVCKRAEEAKLIKESTLERSKRK